MTLLTVKEVAERLRVSPACVYALVTNGQLPAVRIGIRRGVIRFTDEDLQDFINAARSKPAQPPPSRPRRVLKRIVL